MYTYVEKKTNIFIYLLTYIFLFLFSERYIYFKCSTSGKEKGSEGKSKREGALKIKKERASSIQGLGRAEFRVTKVISLFVRKVSSDGWRGAERGKRGGENWKRGGNRTSESCEGCDGEEVRGGKRGRGYSDKAEGSAGCVEFLGIKGDFCNITNCEKKMAEKLRCVGSGRRYAELPLE